MRAALSLVPQVEHEPGPTITFCGHCGASSQYTEISEAPSRVCESCGMGLLLECSRDAAPSPGAAFIVLDASLSVCAVSEAAERLLAMRETEAVNRHLTELVVPADAETQGPTNLAAAVTWAARGDDAVHRATVRPANAFGIRMSARIASCGPPRAALVVFD